MTPTSFLRQSYLHAQISETYKAIFNLTTQIPFPATIPQRNYDYTKEYIEGCAYFRTIFQYNFLSVSIIEDFFFFFKYTPFQLLSNYYIFIEKTKKRISYDYRPIAHAYDDNVLHTNIIFPQLHFIWFFLQILFQINNVEKYFISCTMRIYWTIRFTVRFFFFNIYSLTMYQ